MFYFIFQGLNDQMWILLKSSQYNEPKFYKFKFLEKLVVQYCIKVWKDNLQICESKMTIYILSLDFLYLRIWR